MPLLRKGIALPVKGVDFSKPSTFIDNQAGFSLNMMFSKGELRKRPGKTVQGGQIADATQIMGLGRFDLPGDVKYLVRASKAKLESLNTGTGNWVSIANTDFTGTDSDFFSFATVTENLLFIITNGFDRVRKWTGSGNNALLLGNPPEAKYCTYLSPYLLLANLIDTGNDYPWKIQWCDTGNPENWSTGNSGSYLATDEPSVIQNIAKQNDFVSVYKKNSLVLGRKVDPPDIFKFETVKTGVGLGAPRGFVDAEGTHYFQGLNDFYSWNGVNVKSIGAAVRDEAFSFMDPGQFGRCFAVHIQQLNEIWFFVVNVGSSWPENIWKYKYRLDYWYQDTCAEMTAAVGWERTTTIAWDDLVGTWDQQQGAWNASSNSASWEEIMFGLKTGYSQRLDYSTTNDNLIAVSCSHQTKDFTGDDLEINERWLQFDVWAYGPGKLYLDYSKDFGSNWTNIPFTSSQVYADLTSTVAKYEWYFDTWAPQIRFRLRNAETSETLVINSYAPYYLKREEIWTRR